MFPSALTRLNKGYEAGISVTTAPRQAYRQFRRPGDRIETLTCRSQRCYCFALCSKAGVPPTTDERMAYCQEMLERGMMLGMDPADLWFDPLFLVIKGMQDKQMEVLECIKMLSDMGLNTTGGLSNVSNGMPKHIRPIMDSAMVAMSMMSGLTSAIVNPCDVVLWRPSKSCDIINNNELYADSYLEIKSSKSSVNG